MSSGEVTSYGPAHQTLTVTDNTAGGIRLMRFQSGCLETHVTVDVAFYFTNNPIARFRYRDVTSVVLSKDDRGLDVAAMLNGSDVLVNASSVGDSVPQQGRLVFFNLATGTVLV